eukprot:3788404-Pyramimonas_sp.AAC.1
MPRIWGRAASAPLCFERAPPGSARREPFGSTSTRFGSGGRGAHPPLSSEVHGGLPGDHQRTL